MGLCLFISCVKVVFDGFINFLGPKFSSLQSLRIFTAGREERERAAGWKERVKERERELNEFMITVRGFYCDS